MDFSAGLGASEAHETEAQEQRGATRYTSLIRAAKLVSPYGEFVCVIRDVSATGISLRTFHELPNGKDIALQLQNGETYELRKVRSEGREASFTFAKPVAVERLIYENWNFPKRQIRLNLSIPLTVSTLTQKSDATTENISQQGARVECDTLLAIDQPIRIEGRHFPEIRAKVRWRKDNRYGLVFDNTFTLREFSRTAAALQCPSLLVGD